MLFIFDKIISKLCMKRLILIVRREEDVDDHLALSIDMDGSDSNPRFGISFVSVF